MEIQKDSDRKAEIEQMIISIQNDLENLNIILDKKNEIREEYESSINNTEGAYFKV